MKYVKKNNLLGGTLGTVTFSRSARRKLLLEMILRLNNEYNICHINSGRSYVGFKAQNGIETTKELSDYEFDGKYYMYDEDKCLLEYWKKCKKFTKKYMETWDDLMLFNICFLHEKFLPYYHGGFLVHGAEEILLQLHRFGIFTENGQGNECDELYKEKSYLNAVFYNYDNNYFSKIRLIIQDLKRDGRISLIYYNFLNDEFFDNVPYNTKYYDEERQKVFDSFTLTKDNNEPFSNILKFTKEEYIKQKKMILSEFKEQWFKNIIIIDIFVNEYCDDNKSDEILLFYSNKHLKYYQIDDPFIVEEVD
jgi:hypothetical protein